MFGEVRGGSLDNVVEDTTSQLGVSCNAIRDGKSWMGRSNRQASTVRIEACPGLGTRAKGPWRQAQHLFFQALVAKETDPEITTYF